MLVPIVLYVLPGPLVFEMVYRSIGAHVHELASVILIGRIDRQDTGVYSVTERYMTVAECHGVSSI